MGRLVPPGELTSMQLLKCVKYGLSWLLVVDFDPILETTLKNALKVHGEAIQEGNPSLLLAEIDASNDFELAPFPLPTPEPSTNEKESEKDMVYGIRERNRKRIKRNRSQSER